MGTCRCFRRKWSGVKSQHASVFWSLSPTTFISPVFVNISFWKQHRGTGSLTKKHKRTCCSVEATHKRPGLRLLSSPCQLGAAPLRRRDAISPAGELFIYLFNLIILAEWRCDWRWSNIPTQVDAVCVCVCDDKEATHQWAWISVHIHWSPWCLHLALSKDTDCSQHVRTDTCS